MRGGKMIQGGARRRAAEEMYAGDDEAFQPDEEALGQEVNEDDAWCARWW